MPSLGVDAFAEQSGSAYHTRVQENTWGSQSTPNEACLCPHHFVLAREFGRVRWARLGHLDGIHGVLRPVSFPQGQPLERTPSLGSAETLLCWGGMFRTPFGWSLIEVDPLQFPNKGIPSAMAIHPVWLPFASLGFQEEGLDLVASAPWKEGCGTPVQGKGLDLGPPQCQAFPQPHPPIWQAASGWQCQGLLSWKTVPGCPW